MKYIPDSKVHGANMGPIWGRQDPGGTHVGPMNFAIWDMLLFARTSYWTKSLVASDLRCDSKPDFIWSRW